MRTALLTLTVCLLALPAQAKYSGGTGEPNDPYQIATAADLITLGETPADYDKSFVLTADIDLDPNLPGRRTFDRAIIAPDTEPTRDGLQGTAFGGVLEGDGHAILHLTIEGKGYLGLFGQTGIGAEVRDLGILEVNVTGSGDYVGGLVGYNDHGTVSNSYITSSVGGTRDHVGGLVGYNDGTIRNSYGRNFVSGRDCVGGLVGYNNYDGIVSYCYNAGLVSGHSAVGGIAGYDNVSSSVANSHSMASVSGTGYYIGGLVGYHKEATVAGCYSAGPVRGTGNCHYVGGLVGENAGTVTNSYSTSPVSSTGDYVGGLAGYNFHAAVTNSYATGSVYGERSSVGGLVGWNYFTEISNSYSTGSVSGGDTVGGLVGGNEFGAIWNCYSTGSVSAKDYAGGLVASNRFSPISIGGISNSFWDTQTSNQVKSAGGAGRTTAQMQSAMTFAGWDFAGETDNGTDDIWWIDQGKDYPHLWWEQRKYGGGTGEPNDPYLIFTPEQMNAVGAEPNDWGKCFKLMADIDLAGYTYSHAVIAPDGDEAEAGFQGNSFVGVLDGNWHVIRHLTITGTGYLGLFGQVESGAEIRNLRVVDANITGCDDYIGGLAGFARGDIGTSFVSGTISGAKRVGGLAGRNWGSISASYNTGTVTGNEDVAGLVGGNYGSIVACYSAGAVAADRDAGGLVGENYGSISGSYSVGAVSGKIGAGGLVAYNWEDASVTSSFWGTQTSGQSTSAAGVGKTTAEMHSGGTFTDAGWDFVGETDNGTEDIWWIDEGKDYPRLWWETLD